MIANIRTTTRHYFILLLLALVLVGGAAPLLAANLTNVRVGEHKEKTRVVLELSGQPKPRPTLRVADNQRAVAVDLAAIRWTLPRTEQTLRRASLQRYSYDASQRVMTIATTRPISRATLELLPATKDAPQRVVVDIFFAAPATTVTPAPVRLPVVVLDPGHGGKDPGTYGRLTGVAEKTVALRAARLIKKELEASGRYTVHLTRSGDKFLRLRDRIAIARQHKADLFISIHADAHANRAIRGATVYTLSENASDAEAEALAAKENKADVIDGVDLSAEEEDVTSILIDLAQRETMNMSVRFATLLMDELGKAVRLQRDNKHRFAGFAVLKAPDVPSVLLELGYLSNTQDEKLLLKDATLQAVAKQTLRAVDRYFTWKAQNFSR